MEFAKYYKNFLKRILLRRGIDKPNIEVNLQQMDRFMTQKKRKFDRNKQSVKIYLRIMLLSTPILSAK